MSTVSWRGPCRLALIGYLAGAALATAAFADTAAEIDAKVDLALASLLDESETAAALAERAVGILVFPDIVKGGIIVGGEYGEGALRQGGVTTGYYNIVSASFGLQFGAQSYGKAIFFMTPTALDDLEQSEGLAFGVDVGVSVADQGSGRDIDTSTIQDPSIACSFGEQGLMAGGKLDGSTITKIEC